MKKIISVIALLLIIVLLLGTSGYLVYNATKAANQEIKNPVLSLEVENYGTVKIELYPEYAPNTVKNIIALAKNGYYNGKVFYGMDDVALYVGRNSEGSSTNPTVSDIDKSLSEDDKNNSEINYEYEIDGEFIANNFKQNTLKHEKGIVSLVRADYTKQIQTLTNQSYNSGSSQFTVIMGDDASSLNGVYAGFGKVIEGLDIVEKIYALELKPEESAEGDDATNVSVSDEDSSIKPFATFPVITNATVETYDEEYGLPEYHEAFDYSAYLQDLMSRYYSSNQ